MDITSIEEYLDTHEKRQIKRGKSGAEVWEIEDKYVLKHVQREKLPEPGAFALYRKEAYFYQLMEQNRSKELFPCLPEVLKVQASDEAILIFMKKYQELSRDAVNEELLWKIMKALAVIHTREIPGFLRQEVKKPEYLEEDQVECCLLGWRSVLAEHPGEFDEKLLIATADRINEVIDWHHREEQVLSHGDFHWDNLLRGENGNIVICDWQGVNAGGASGDISFFLSRLGADQIVIEPEKAVELYIQERQMLTGKAPSKEDMLRHMHAANVITSFRFWHQYLHNSASDRVRGIYEKMILKERYE